MKADDLITAIGGVGEHIIEESAAGSRQMRDRFVSKVTTWAACIGLVVSMGVFTVLLSVLYGRGTVSPQPANTGANVYTDVTDNETDNAATMTKPFYMQDGKVLRLSELSDDAILTAISHMDEVFEIYFAGAGTYFDSSDMSEDYFDLIRTMALGPESLLFEKGTSIFDIPGGIAISFTVSADMADFIKIYYLTFYEVYFDTSKLNEAELSELRERIEAELSLLKEQCSFFNSGSVEPLPPDDEYLYHNYADVTVDGVDVMLSWKLNDSGVNVLENESGDGWSAKFADERWILIEIGEHDCYALYDIENGELHDFLSGVPGWKSMREHECEPAQLCYYWDQLKAVLIMGHDGNVYLYGIEAGVTFDVKSECGITERYGEHGLTVFISSEAGYNGDTLAIIYARNGEALSVCEYDYASGVFTQGISAYDAVADCCVKLLSECGAYGEDIYLIWVEENGVFEGGEVILAGADDHYYEVHSVEGTREVIISYCRQELYGFIRANLDTGETADLRDFMQSDFQCFTYSHNFNSSNTFAVFNGYFEAFDHESDAYIIDLRTGEGLVASELVPDVSQKAAEIAGIGFNERSIRWSAGISDDGVNIIITVWLNNDNYSYDDWERMAVASYKYNVADGSITETEEYSL